MYKFMYILGGIILAVFGYRIIVRPRFYDNIYGRYWDFTEIKWVFGVSLIIIGVFIIFNASRKKAKDFEEKLLICPKCKTPFNQKDVTDGQCPKCEVQLEDLKGFYERHPELKVSDDKEPSNSKNEKQ